MQRFRAFPNAPHDSQNARAGVIVCGRQQAPQKKSPSRTPALRIEPEKRLCPAFDPVSIATFPVAEPEEMGYRVLDNFCEEHIQ